MLLNRLTIRWKLTLLAGVSLVVIVSILVTMSVHLLRDTSVLVTGTASQMLDVAARHQLDTQLQVQSAALRKRFQKAVDLGAGFALQASGFKSFADAQHLPAAVARDQLNRDIFRAVEANRDVLGLFVAFEPDAFDGRDAGFINQAALGSNDAGRFSVYWARSAKGLEQQILTEAAIADATPNASAMANNAWYRCPVDQGRACAFDPYVFELDGHQVLMTSVAFPITLQGRTIGSLR
ncbi:cache domain-containing protein [Pseudomonas sp. KU43P]|uniref:cache domain-containing protein n=1 Tax=Pseudomonas sp. KU43P TaxID=2487887 RepID=UPI0012A8B8E4|nr:cache domain-containing protein [Pseudomonas sp. KU43P]BBH45757.1 hypothetical protein KU43P_22340 [Pseudomonas sp. KU43P]